MPLDPTSWANAAMATLAPGNGSLAQVLDSIRGTEFTVHTHGGRIVRGRVVMVEHIVNEPDPTMRGGETAAMPSMQDSRDWKLTVLSRGHMEVVRLSKVKAVTLHDGSVIMLAKLHKDYDPHDRVAAMNYMHSRAAAGELVTGLIYMDPNPGDLHASLNTTDTPLNRLGAKELCPGSAALEKINASLR